MGHSEEKQDETKIRKAEDEFGKDIFKSMPNDD